MKKRTARKKDIKIEQGCEQIKKKAWEKETHTERKRDDKKFNMKLE